MRGRRPGRGRAFRRTGRLAAPLVLAALTSAASAQEVSGAPDVTIDLNGTLVRPADLARDVEVLLPTLVDLGPLPRDARVSAYTPGAGALRLFALDHTLLLPGGVLARPRDVVQWNGASYAIALDGAASGIPPDVAIDALALDPVTGAYWLSFDTPALVFGKSLRDADVVNASTGALVFDASAAGVPAGSDVDGVSPGLGADLFLSFDVGGVLGGVAYADEDVLRYAGGVWALVMDGSAADPDWGPADLGALHLPEPDRLTLLVSGLLALHPLRRRIARAAAGL